MCDCVNESCATQLDLARHLKADQSAEVICGSTAKESIPEFLKFCVQLRPAYFVCLVQNATEYKKSRSISVSHLSKTLQKLSSTTAES